MKTHFRGYIVLMLLFTCVATGLLWWKALRSQALLRERRQRTEGDENGQAGCEPIDHECSPKV